MSDSGVLKLGIAGLGLAANMVLRGIEGRQDVRFVAVADVNPARLGALKQSHGARGYESVEALCADPEVDTVWIATPTQLHCEHTVRALDQGKHVIVEKPMAVTLEDAARMIDAAQRNNRLLLCGGSRSGNPIVQRMREVVVSGELGPVRAMTSWAATDWMLRPRRPDELAVSLGGGIVYRQSPHQIDTVRLLGGGIVRAVRGFTGQWMLGRDTAPGYYSALLSFANGINATVIYDGYGYFSGNELFDPAASGPEAPGAEDRVNARRQIQGGGRDETAAKVARLQPAASASRPSNYLSDLGLLHVACEHGEMRQSPNGIYVYTDAGVREEPVDTHGGSGTPEIQELLDALSGVRPLLHSGTWGLATLEVCLALEQSMKEQRDIGLDHQTGVPAESKSNPTR